jgi:photosystem II stability/assembly factor-like uncharacterized protein
MKLHVRSLFFFSVFALALGVVSPRPLRAQIWRSMGPPGGDVVSLVADPHHPHVLYLGTTDGHVFVSRNDGADWQLDGRVGHRLDSVVDTLIVDPRDSQRLFAGVWTLNPAAGGGVFESQDGGRTWHALGLTTQQVRALAQAPSDPNVLVAGTLTGVYRSPNDGKTWKLISPPGSEEIRNLDSLAIDPRNPDVVYAGTYHLPWKTVDGGKRWFPIHAGMIDDSDVFSILVDKANPRRVFLSACSGIYRSDNGGLYWVKVQGIPTSARRTLAIAQDPLHHGTVYAGTTEGLWKTVNGGASWQRMTPDNWIINALVVDPLREGRIVMGTERLGVVISNDGARTFSVSNSGFNHRQIAAVALDRNDPNRVLALLSDAPDPVVVTDDGGKTWRPLGGAGLHWESVRRVYAAPAEGGGASRGWWAALSAGGLMRYDRVRNDWSRAGELVGEAAWTFQNGRLIKPDRRLFDLVVRDMAFSSHGWYVATRYGLLRSLDRGATWREVRFAPLILPVRSVAASPDGRRLWVATENGLAFSRDAGLRWSWHNLPQSAGNALRLEIAGPETLLALTQKGLFISYDSGANWQHAAHGLPEVPIRDVAVAGKTLLASVGIGGLFVSHDLGHSWSPVPGALADGDFPVVAALPGSDVIYAASASDGLFAVNLGASGSSTVATTATHAAHRVSQPENR